MFILGDYTELKTHFYLKPETPLDVIDILKYVADMNTQKPILPDHKLFKCPRWTHLFNCSSAYFNNEKHTEIKLDGDRWYINTQANFKNYDDEIRFFWDWIEPYIDCVEGKKIGEVTLHREYSNEVYLDNGKIVMLKNIQQDDVDSFM